MNNEWLVLTGSVSLTLALVEAWVLVIALTNPSSGLARLIVDVGDLIKSHIDYLLMSLFLFVFYLLLAHFQIRLHSFIIVSLCVGSLGNPALFLVRALNPDLKQNPTAIFRLAMSASCILTTLGYLTGVWLIAASAWVKL
jgi:hypothetical protein